MYLDITNFLQYLLEETFLYNLVTTDIIETLFDIL